MKKSYMMKKYFNIAVLTVCTILSVACACIGFRTKSDQDIVSSVLQLSGNRMFCTGVQITTPTGHPIVITAGHCKELASNGLIFVETEDHKTFMRKIIAEDPDSDLLVLEAVPNLPGLDVSKYTWGNQHVRTFTHGHHLKTYETDGIAIENWILDIPSHYIASPEDAQKCLSMPKYQILEDNLCVFHVMETVTTAKIVPGSSGGPVVNDDGELIGIASATDGETGFGYYVPLEDIHRFIAKY